MDVFRLNIYSSPRIHNSAAFKRPKHLHSEETNDIALFINILYPKLHREAPQIQRR